LLDEYTDWLIAHEQEVLPHVVFVGEITNVTHVYVIVGKHKYLYCSVVSAVEACYKCLSALNTWPFISDFIWMFITKCVYKFSDKKCYSALLKLCVELKKSDLTL